MATTIGEVNINLRMSLAQFKQDVQDGSSSATKSMQGMKDAVASSSSEATASLALIGEEIGVNIPRHIRTFIAEIPGVGTALSSAFSGVAIIAIIEVITKIVEKIQDYRDHLEQAAAAWTDTQEKGQAALQALDEQILALQVRIDELNNDHAAALADQLKLIDAQKFDQLSKQFDNLTAAADATFQKSKVGFLANAIGLGSDSGVQNVQNELDAVISKVKELAAQGKNVEIGDALNKQIQTVLDSMVQINSFNGTNTAGGQAIYDALQHELDQLNLMYSAYQKINSIALDKGAIDTTEALQKSTEEAKKLADELNHVMDFLDQAGVSSRTVSKGGTNPYQPTAGAGINADPTGLLGLNLGAGQPQAPLYGGTKEAQDQLDLLTDQNAQIKLSQDLYTSTRTAEEQYANKMQELNTLLATGAISQDTYNRAVSQAKDKYDDLTIGLNKIGSAIGSDIEQAALYGGSWTKAFEDIAAAIVKAVIQMTILKSLQQASAANGGGGGLGFLSAILGGFTARASGGSVLQGSGYLVGENGPEFFTPTTSGTIIPNGGMGGGNQTHVEHNEFHFHGVTDADSFKRSQTQIAADMAAQLSVSARRNG